MYEMARHREESEFVCMTFFFICNRSMLEILDKHKKSSGLQSYDKLNIYSSLSSVCSRLKDIECMKEVIVFNKDNKREDIYLIVQVAQLEKISDPIASIQYYLQALKIINDMGGKSYVENLNKNSEVTLNYEEIINGSN